jgi:hypothetical protein
MSEPDESGHVTCAALRRSLLADPGHMDGAVRAHLGRCAECAAWAHALSEFERRLGRAMQLRTAAVVAADVVAEPAAFPGSGARRRRVPRGRWVALAASLVAAVAAATILMLAIPRQSLAHDVVLHMAAEPQAWATTDVAVPAASLAAVLDDAGMRLKPDAGLVSYANSCGFRGHQVPHLVVQTVHGPVTVMVLRHESPAQRVRFDDQGYRGIIVPVPGHGSLAVLAHDQSMDAAMVDAIAARVRLAIVWTG